jgi:hypothetical protein
MTPVKVNIFISYAPEDKPQLDKLQRWLYPMRDEVNIYFYDPPKKPVELPLPWQILLFWYSPPDFRDKYEKTHHSRRDKAHIYLFLASYKSLSNNQIEDDIDIAVRRRIKGDDFLGPFVFPVILSPSRWKAESRLAAFKPLAGGTPLSSYKQEDEGYLKLTEELAALIKLVQTRLGEVKFQQSRLASADQTKPNSGKRPLPYLGDADDSMEFQETAPFQPSEWLGWGLLLFLFVSVVSSLLPARILRPTRYETLKPGEEYLRENPMRPPKDSLVFPKPD